MKLLRDPESGKVFGTAEAAVNYFCGARRAQCEGCQVGLDGCALVGLKSMEEVAELLGYEADELEKDEAQAVVNKPLSEWTLGEVKAFCVERTNGRKWEGLGAECEECPLNVVCAIPASEWMLEEKPRLTEAEAAICRAVGAKWVSRDKGFDDVFLWSDKPRESKDNERYYLPSGLGDCIARTRAKLFPSLKQGDCVEAPE